MGAETYRQAQGQIGRDFLRWLRPMLYVLSLLLALPVLFELFTLEGWLFDIISHFRLVYMVGALVVLLLSLLLKRYVLVVFNLVVLVVLGSAFTPYYLHSDVQDKSPTERLLSINLWSSNEDYEKVKKLIAEESPDKIVLMELTSRWQKELKPLHGEFPYRTEVPREDNFGIALWSKTPPRQFDVVYWNDLGVPSIWAKYEGARGDYTLLATHPVPPATKRKYLQRNKQLEVISRWVLLQQTPVIVSGDLNTTPFSSSFKRLTTLTGLQEARSGQCHCPTWPAIGPFPMLAIDHCLVTDGLQVHSFRTGREIGSDHLPVVVDYALQD